MYDDISESMDMMMVLWCSCWMMTTMRSEARSPSLAKLGRLSGESGQWEDNLIIVIIITIVILIIVFITWKGHRQHS